MAANTSMSRVRLCTANLKRAVLPWAESVSGLGMWAGLTGQVEIESTCFD